jgi:hypothetical protein
MAPRCIRNPRPERRADQRDERGHTCQQADLRAAKPQPLVEEDQERDERGKRCVIEKVETEGPDRFQETLEAS